MRTQLRRNSAAKCLRGIDLGRGAKTQFAARNAQFHRNSGAARSCCLMGDGYAGPCAAGQVPGATCVSVESPELVRWAEVPR